MISDRTMPLVNEFASARGDYGNATTLAPDVKGAQRLTVTINRGGTAVDRWDRDDLLSETQMAAIRYCWRLWADANTERGVVANFNRIGGIDHSDNGMDQQYALSELTKFKADVPPSYWTIFENVCRFDEPGGVAGSRLTSKVEAQNTAARMIVCFVADLIAMWRRL